MAGKMLEENPFTAEQIKMIKTYAELYGIDGQGLTMTDEDVLLSIRKTLNMTHTQIIDAAETLTK